jgi:hypothetical protein
MPILGRCGKRAPRAVGFGWRLPAPVGAKSQVATCINVQVKARPRAPWGMQAGKGAGAVRAVGVRRPNATIGVCSRDVH